MAGLEPQDLVLGSIPLAVSALLAAIAVLVWRAYPRKPANQLFALFLLVIAANGVLDGGIKLLGGVADPEHGAVARLLDRLGLALLALDPGLLLYFAALYPRRSRLADHRLFAPALVATWCLLLGALVAAPAEFAGPRSAAGPRLLLAYLAVCYLGAYALLLRQLRSEANPLLLRQQRLLVAAFGVALLFRVALVPQEVQLLPRDDPLASALADVATNALAFALLGAAAWWSLRGAADPARAAILDAHRLTLAGLVVLALSHLPLRLAATALAAPAESTLHFLDLVGLSGVYGVRWVVFAVIGGYAVLRYQVLDIEVRFERVGSGAVAATLLLLLLVGAWVLGEAAAPLAAQVGAGHVLALAAALAAAPPLLRWGVRQARSRLPAAPADGHDLARRLEFYRAGLETALDGRAAPGNVEAELQPLRAQLGISEEQHRVLVGIVRAERERGPLRVRDRQLGARYRLDEVLGEGSHGRCWLARDLLLGRAVVVKEVPTLPGTNGHLGEARAAGRLSHPNIVTVFDVVEAPGLTYIVMEHAARGSLSQAAARGRLETAEAVAILGDILAGLAAAHGQGIVHGDLKPGNILLSGEGRAKLADFGSAAASGAAGTLASLPSRAGPGTVAYLAPEQVEGAAPSASSDLYAVAAIAYELLAGRHYLDLQRATPFEVMERILRSAPRLDRPGIPAGLRPWLARGLAKDPAARWPSAAAMAAGLAAAARVPGDHARARAAPSLSEPAAGKGPSAGRAAASGRRR